MSFHDEKVPNAPIIIHTHEPSPGMVGNIPEAQRHLIELVNQQPEPVYLIMELTGVSMGLDDLIKTSNDAARGPGALLHHPNIIETLFVLTDKFMKFGTMGMTSEAFGKAKVRVFDTVEQALDYCRERIAEQEQGG